ncbi:hypothetical protein DFH07DRAFT_1056851 [Mycena maculata]|uniref:Uncharacterized protein n=1 Tax=Mycena maculata TaxID=230809 RepID=A0AAD7K2J7_9AGAR|nr:hypothetical protein DFH07DRAFT_1056851 [Mycena maculata]
MPTPFKGPKIHPEDCNNPTCEHFARNRPVEKHFVISPRLFDQRCLDRAGRAICRIVYAHGVKIETIAHISCVSDDTVRRALQNKPRFDEQPDTIENDYAYVDPEYSVQYPPISSHQSHGRHARRKAEEKPKKVKTIIHATQADTKPRINREPSIIDPSEDTPPPPNKLDARSPSPCH